MSGNLVYADLEFPKSRSTSQHTSSSQCPRWHWIALGLSLVINIILMGTVIGLALQVKENSGEALAAKQSESTQEGSCSCPEDFKASKINHLCTSQQCSTKETSAPCLVTPQAAVHVEVHQTAILPLCLKVPNQAWDFIEIQWFSARGNHSILLYQLNNCTREDPNWWQRHCKASTDIRAEHRLRMTVLPNGSLRICKVQAEDAGTYRVIVKGKDMTDTTGQVNLTVTGR
ncbi:uncharacterized protein LOC102574243 isoform X2 [Alligator mississippiensis]|uniref:uncharacterized protein LOC102574243 isoform X2 n=1 Tax=Alligator mississippiensis TaxID=8496 RepID=UPI000711CFB6|nr:uncharacterized protein LOC102574243 isoform X2 [Alligator mississippiensis]